MKIAFFGLKSFFDYYKIGGFQSYIRRLALKITSCGHGVDYILYGSQKNKEIEVMPNLKLRYFQTFKGATDAMSGTYEHIIRIWLSPYDRIRYILFFIREQRFIKFDYIWLTWPDSIIKRKLILLEIKITSYFGRIICTSYRQNREVKKLVRNTAFILPPVPEDYFLLPNKKPYNKKIKITFLGMLHPDKGIRNVIALFKRIKDDPRFECCIYGIHNPKNKESFKIHNWLREQKDLKYIEIDKEKYSLKIEEGVKKVLKETDIFIQPYERLQNTLDTPLLLLEAMASLCCIITTPIGSIPEIYGKSDFIINKKDFLPRTTNFLRDISYEKIKEERNRIYKQNKKLNFGTSKAAKKFFEYFKENKKNEPRF